MKTLIKKINLMAVAALIIGTSAAFAGRHHLAEQNVFNAGTNDIPNWQPLTRSLDNSFPYSAGTYRCASEENKCTGHQDPVTMQVTDIQEGAYTENP